MKYIVTSLLVLICYNAKAQYTDIINSNRPGESFGAYSVGANILQLEAGLAYGESNHTSVLIPDRSTTEFQFQLRYGLPGMERLELIWDGRFAQAEDVLLRGGVESVNEFSNFPQNTIGAKFLIYDPNIKKTRESPNLYSWKKNNLPQWSDLIPSISVYAGVNLILDENPFKFPGEPNYSTKAAVITQNNFGRWVLVSNIIVDKPSTEFPTYAGIFTLTHSLYARTGIFAEFQTYISDIYSDEILRGGVAFLVNENLQVDVSGLINFKNTPDRWRFGIGASYRLDMHESDELIFENEIERELYLEEQSNQRKSRRRYP